MSRQMFHPDDAATFFKKNAGQPYQPSNGHEGEIFYATWCADCVHEAEMRADPDCGKGCRVLAFSICSNPGNPEYPKELIWGDDGQPKCTRFSAEVDGEPRCEKTVDMFGEK